MMDPNLLESRINGLLRILGARKTRVAQSALHDIITSHEENDLFEFLRYLHDHDTMGKLYKMLKEENINKTSIALAADEQLASYNLTLHKEQYKDNGKILEHVVGEIEGECGMIVGFDTNFPEKYA